MNLNPLEKKLEVVSETSPIYVLHKAYMPRVLLKWVLSLIIQRKYTRFRAGQNEIAKAIGRYYYKKRILRKWWK
jgi:hypothetical protein